MPLFGRTTKKNENKMKVVGIKQVIFSLQFMAVFVK